jgi:hypothetical protein
MMAKDSKPMDKHQVAEKMAQAIDAAIFMAREAGVAAHEIADLLEQRADGVRQRDAMLRPVL